MKANLETILLILLLAVAPYAHADGQPGVAQTNAFRLSENDIRDEIGEEESYYVNCLIHHISMPETLPSELDTNGNWGTETNGLQMSLRFRHKQYTIGDQVPAVIILRNLQPNTRILLLTNSSSCHFTLLLRYGSSQFLPEKEDQIIERRHYYVPLSGVPSGISKTEFAGKSEKMVALDLRRVFDLNQAGSYKATAICWVYSSDTNVLYEVESGSASFTLVNPAKSPQ